MVRDTVPDAPGGRNLAVPSGYSIQPDAIWLVDDLKRGPRFRAIAYGPILITQRLEVLPYGDLYLAICWRNGPHEKWNACWLPRQQMVSGRQMSRLFSYGFPACPWGLGAVKRYLARLEWINYERIPTIQMRAGEFSEFWVGHR